MRLTHLVNYDCLLLQVYSKNWLERVEKRINCSIQQNAQQGNRFLWNMGSFISTAKFCINVFFLSNTVKKGNREISESAHESELTKANLHFVEITVFSIIISRLLACESDIYGLK